jgi:hypothetical protein
MERADDNSGCHLPQWNNTNFFMNLDIIRVLRQVRMNNAKYININWETFDEFLSYTCSLSQLSVDGKQIFTAPSELQSA